MKRKLQPTEFRYSPMGPRHHGGPVGYNEREIHHEHMKPMNIRAYNGLILRRKIRLAYDDARMALPPRLVKKAHFENNPH